jgi:hypothetical protein
MADLDFLERSSPVQIVGGNEEFPADVTGQKELKIVDALRQEGTQAALSVGTTPVEVKAGSLPLQNRKMVTVFNNSTQRVFWGFTDSVTAMTGTPIGRNEIAFFRIEGTLSLWLVVESGTSNVRITEAF